MTNTVGNTDGFWFFAYGSLMWDPPFEPEEVLPARIFGWHRSFCVLSETYRGTPQNPGLSLGLDRGGSCAGVAFRIGPENRTAALRAIEVQELVDDPIYLWRKVTLHLARRQVQGYTLVVNRNDRIFSGNLGFEDTVRRIVSATGSRGTNLDYLTNTVRRLRQMEIAPGRLGELKRRAMEIAGATPPDTAKRD